MNWQKPIIYTNVSNMQKINILYLITKLELGGAQKQLLSIISGLDKERFGVFLFTAQKGLMLSDAGSINGLILKRSKWLERPLNPFKDILAFFEIYALIKKNNIQIVHTHSSKAGILGRLSAGFAKVKFIYHTVHGWSFNDFQPFFLRKLFILLERLSARFTDKIIVVSYSDQQKGLANHIGDPDKFQLIRYGIGYSGFTLNGRDIIRKALGIGMEELTVGMVSCFKPQKAPQDFIRLAFLVNQSMPGVKFILVGDGVLRGRIQALINKFNLQGSVILTGWRRDIHRILSAIDVLALTSLWEGLPITVLEAMAASVPVIATNTGGIAEVIIDGETGFLVSPQDTRGMSEKLTLLLKDAALRKQVGRNAKNNLNGDFALTNMVKNYQDLYRSLFFPLAFCNL
ncbi:MAG: glycosyltransferase family 4 protein [Candidatus Omnitrophica bacterium]|nr:glycosyltransferase family 4 protein [Candidatus Omnitrophota bacterium]MBU4468481.1 glycosyltransferase family 4 protein [Candidatus Omnitrophota bacterium]MCG2707524.1 glycosyltransferase family 4 protein [Candidatus Omnitrophota bacterium]